MKNSTREKLIFLQKNCDFDLFALIYYHRSIPSYDFVLFRQAMWEKSEKTTNQHWKSFSTIAHHLWKNLPVAEKNFWVELSSVANELNQEDKEYSKLLTASKKIQSIQIKFQRFFAQWQDFLSQQNQLIRTQQKIKYADYGQYFSAFVASASSALGGYYSIEGGYLGAGAGILGVWTSYLTSERYKTHAENIQKRWGATETIREQTIDKFIQAVAKLEKNYQQLIKLHQNLSLLNKEPTGSEKLNKFFNNFLVSFAELKEVVEKFNNDIKRGQREITAVNFAQAWQTSWKKVNENITNLTKEIYKQEIFYYEETLPILPSTSNRVASALNNNNSNTQLTSNETIELATFSDNSSSNQEYQTQTIQQPEPVILRIRKSD